MFNTIIYYMSDIKAAGGVIILEKLLKKSITKSLYRGTLFINNKFYKVDIMTYKKGEGIITNIYSTKDWEELLIYMAHAIENNTGNIQCIRKTRITYALIGNIEIVCLMICAYSLLKQMQTEMLLPTLSMGISSVILTVITTAVTCRAMRQ